MQNNILQLGHLAQSQIQQLAFAEAEKTLQQILLLDPRECNALQLYGYVLASLGKNKECIQVLQKARTLLPNEYSVLMNLGKALFDGKEYLQAIEVYETISQLYEKDPNVLMDIGTSYTKLGKYDQAISSYREALQYDPFNSDITNNLSVAFYKFKKYDDALRYCEITLEVSPSHFMAWSNKGNILFDRGLYEEALSSYEKALSINPSFSEGWTNVGNAMLKLHRPIESLSAHDNALKVCGANAEAFASKGATLFYMSKMAEALEFFKKAHELNEQIALSMVIYLKLYFSDWSNIEDLKSSLLTRLREGATNINPFAILPLPFEGKVQKQCAIQYCEASNNQVFQETSFHQNNSKKKLRIGYISSDFGNHPVGRLMLNVLSLHNAEEFELIGFYLKEPIEDECSNKIKSRFHETHMLSQKSAKFSAEVIRNCQIDILVDLNGHTANAREDILAQRLAPIQVSYLGYPGSVGLNSIDYLVADPMIIPPEDRDDYLAKVAYLPSFFPAYQPLVNLNNGRSRSAAGLPEKGFIFCCFNGSYKITPDVFEIWMRLLKGVPDSVLWLTNPTNKGVENLRSEALLRGVDPKRLIFARRKKTLEDHLLRLSLADLFLDTFYYNAHTTACDALSVGVPVLTKRGKTFASRVASSMLEALEIPDLICHTDQEYEERALEIASNPDSLADLRQKIKAKQSSTKLFDLKSYVKNLEVFYLQSFDRFNRGLPLESIVISDFK